MKEKIRIERGFYDNGNPAHEIKRKNDLWHGLFIGWYENGNIQCEFSYKKHIQHGIIIEFKY